MKKILAIAFIVILLVTVLYDVTKAVFGYNSATLQMWIHSSAFNNVRVGDTTGKVKSMFGSPNKRESNDRYITWEYKIKSSIGITDDVWVSFGTNHHVTSIFPEYLTRTGMFSKISLGMTEKQVERLLGKPNRLRQSSIYESWFYTHWNGSKHTIWFDKSGRVLHALVSYEEFLGVESLSCSRGCSVRYR